MTAKALLQAAGDGTAPAAGYIGSVTKSAQTSYTNIAASGNYGNMTSIVLPAAGIFTIDSWINLKKNSASFSSTLIIFGVTTSSASSTGFSYGINAGFMQNQISTAFTVTDLPVPRFTVKFDGTTITKLDDDVAFAAGSTLYLVMYVDTFTTATPQWQGKLVATRIA